MREPEAAAYQPTVAEQSAHFFGRRIRGNVEIFRVSAEQQVADTATHQVSLITRILQSVEHLEGGGRNIGPTDIVFGPRYHPRAGAVVWGSIAHEKTGVPKKRRIIAGSSRRNS